MYNDYTIGGMISSVVVPGMLVVLVALAIMVACIYLMSRAVGRIERGKKASEPAASTKKEAPAQVSAAPATAPPVDDASSSLAGETVAAICAAVACMVPTPHAVTSIVPAAPAPAVPPRQRPVWGFAGMQQNTRPF